MCRQRADLREARFLWVEAIRKKGSKRARVTTSTLLVVPFGGFAHKMIQRLAVRSGRNVGSARGLTRCAGPSCAATTSCVAVEGRPRPSAAPAVCARSFRTAQSRPRDGRSATLERQHPAAGIRFASTNTKVGLQEIRNISAWGHIDAGKTTLTERLLYHTGGLTSSPEELNAARNAALPGDVDDGSTVTDFLEQERERGITIQSAAVGPLWWTSQAEAAARRGAITLIDTPGHIDFTIEVERALRVADGCIVVMDSVEGVEAQTETNWKIGKRYGVQSNLLFLNKLDRQGASISKSIKSFVARGLHPRPVLIQLPLLPANSQGTELDGGIEGVVDLIHQQEIRFEGRAGEQMAKSDIRNAALAAEARRARYALVETVASLDEELMEELFNLETQDEPHHHISPASLKAAIRRQTVGGKIVPALLGSAAKNVGIQPLLDAVVDFLPGPGEAGDVRDSRGTGNGTVHAFSEQQQQSRSKRSIQRSAPSQAAASKKNSAAAMDDGPSAVARSSNSSADADAAADNVSINVGDKDLTALAFKVVWDKKRGPMTFVRVYSGVLARNTSLFNTTTRTRERLNRILLPFGSTYTEVDQLVAGQVGVILGLRDTRTGDTLVDNRSKNMDPTLRLRRVEIPPPVFSVSVEPHSKSDEESVNEALAMLVRTDPSLRIDNGFDDAGSGSAFGAAGTNQTILSGMGELHLEIAKDRLKNEFGVKTRIGGVRVSYRETIAATEERNGWHVRDEVVEKDLGGKRVKVGARVAIKVLEDASEEADSSLGDNRVEVVLADGEASGRGNYESTAEQDRSENVKQRRHSKDTSRSGDARETSASEQVTQGADAEAVRRSVMSGVTAAISRGPLSSHPLTNLFIRVSNVQTFSPEVSPPQAISSIVHGLVRTVVREAAPRMMEPVMRVRIATEEAYLGRVVGDVTSEQAGEIVEVEHEQAAEEGGQPQGAQDFDNISQVYVPEDWALSGTASPSGEDSPGVATPGPGPRQKTTVVALVPLARLTSYSSRLRALTAGGGNYTMQLEGFRAVSDERQKEILSELGRM